MRNKKGVALFGLLAILLLVIVAVYFILYLPFEPLKKIKNFVNYILIIIIFFLMQVGIVYGYYRLTALAIRGFKLYKTKLLTRVMKLENTIMYGR